MFGEVAEQPTNRSEDQLELLEYSFCLDQALKLNVSF